MIDEKKIEEAIENTLEKEFWGNGTKVFQKSNSGLDYVEMFYGDHLRKAFKMGAHWAIQEFLKGLWHPASKIPKKGKPILCWMNIKYRPCFIYVYNDLECYNWNTVARLQGIEKWCYLNDLLPKQKGGEG